MLLALKSQVFEVNLLLSTLNPDIDTQSDSTSISRPIPVRKRNASSRGVSRRGSKASSSRTKKPTVTAKPAMNNTSEDMPVEENTLTENLFDRSAVASTSTVLREAEEDNSPNNIRKKNQKQQEQSRRLLTQSPASTTSCRGNRKMSEGQKKLVSTIFSNIMKRKSRSDDESFKEEADECVDVEGNVSRSPPPRLVAKKARLVFQKCLQSTFDPRMLPGHDVVLVEDSDENNSD